MAAGAGWLRRIRIYERHTVNLVALCEGLEWLGALPEDFGPGPGGVPPQRHAILTGDAEYRFTWTIERRDGGGPWESVSVIPCE